MMGVEPTGTVTQAVHTSPERHSVAHVTEDFKQVLTDALEQVNDHQLQAEALHNELAEGQTDNLHQVAVAAEKASLSLQLALQVRNKAVEAYQEIMRMQI